MKKKGFTLVELLAVIAILAILVIIALPNIMSLFNEAKMNSFINEIRNIIKGAQNQWMSDSMFDTNEIAYSRVKGSNCTNQLKLSGREEINYYIKINKAGKVTEYYIEDGSYQYSYNGNGLNIEDIETVQQIAKMDPSSVLTITCDGGNGGSQGNQGNQGGNTPVPVDPYITFVNQQVTGEITTEDEVQIGSEHFYVISTNSNETVLLAKYNLYVGGKVTEACTAGDCGTKSFSYTAISTSDSKYGLQNSTANAYNTISYPPDHSSMMGKSSTSYGFVAFAGTNYWDIQECSYSTPSAYTCSNTRGLVSEYANSSNGPASYSSNYPYVYNSTLSSTSYNNVAMNSCGSGNAAGCGTINYASDNGYTIAYYIEEYINRLRTLGASPNIVGRLLTYTEATSLSNKTKGSQTYWCGNASSSTYVYGVSKGNNVTTMFYVQPNAGAKPVIVVPTNEIVL